MKTMLQLDSQKTYDTANLIRNSCRAKLHHLIRHRIRHSPYGACWLTRLVEPVISGFVASSLSRLRADRGLSSFAFIIPGCMRLLRCFASINWRCRQNVDVERGNVRSGITDAPTDRTGTPGLRCVCTVGAPCLFIKLCSS